MKKIKEKRLKNKQAKAGLKKSFFSFGIFKNMKIAPRILLGFLIIAILGTGMGLYDSIVLNQVSASGSAMYKEMLLPLRTTSDISDYFLKESIAIRNAIMSDSKTMADAYITEIGNDQISIKSALKDVGALVYDSSAKEKLKDLDNVFLDYNTKINAALDNLKQGNMDAVKKDLMHSGDLSSSMQNVNKALASLNTALTSKSAAQDTQNKKEADFVQKFTLFLIFSVIGLSVVIGITTSLSISKPVKKLTRAVAHLADGETDINEHMIDSKNEVGEMGIACSRILASIKKLEEDTDTLIAAAAEGHLNVRADAGNHKGAYKKIIEGFNATLDTVTQPLNEAAMVMNEISTGNLDNRVESDFSGDYAIVKNSLNRMIDRLQELITDTEALAQAAIEGSLSFRADAEKHEGAYKKIIEGFNATLDAVILPISESVKVLQELSRGNLDISVTGDYSGDHAVIKHALNETISTLKKYISEITFVLGEITKADFSHNIQTEYLGDFVELKNSINEILENLNGLMREITNASDQMATSTRQLSEASQAISVGATEQASSIEELTASLGTITEQTQQNAKNSEQSNKMAFAAKQAAAQCSGQMQDMLKSMNDINESSENISKIIKVIDDIAFQTNILALNAAVEAARAGVHGKGFAVVAEEVRSLAARSADAAKETAELIEGSIKKVSIGTKIANDTADALANIVKNVDQSAQLGDRIAAASSEQASGIAQINLGLAQVSQVVQTNSATAEQGAAASQELYGQAELLKRKMEVFRLRDSQSAFKETESAGVPDTDFFTNDLKY